MGRKKLVILRGKPGSGKTSVAKEIQKRLLPQQVAILCPDYFYWQVFPEEDNKHLVNQVLNYATQRYLENGYLVILEGILPKSENGELFNWLEKYCQKNGVEFVSIYLDVSLRKALTRNRKRSKGKKISNEDMRKWYKSSKAKEIPSEMIVDTNNLSLDQVVKEMLKK